MYINVCGQHTNAWIMLLLNMYSYVYIGCQTTYVKIVFAERLVDYQDHVWHTFFAFSINSTYIK